MSGTVGSVRLSQAGFFQIHTRHKALACCQLAGRLEPFFFKSAGHFDLKQLGALRAPRPWWPASTGACGAAAWTSRRDKG